MSPTRIYSIVLRQVILNRRSWGRWVGLLYWPTIDLVVWGTLSVFIQKAGGGQFNAFVFLIGSVILMNFIWRSQQGIAVSFLEDVWTRNFVNLFSSPLTLGEYIVGLTATAILRVLFSIAAMCVLAWLLFAFNIFAFGFYLIPFLAILFIFSVAVGFFSVGITLRIGPSAEALVWSIPAIIAPLSGAMYPISVLPLWIQKISLLLPSTYVFEGMRAVIVAGAFNTQALGIAFLLSVFYLLFSIYYVFRSYRTVLRRGLFSRFSTTD
ncbi:MAG: ABC transporter permease [Patescibacteria group bacterium]